MISLGDRMKEYEQTSRLLLTRRMPLIIRVDGKAFHTFTKGFNKPWDEELATAMTCAAQELMKNIQGAKLAYVQSDEISVLVTDYDSLAFEPWFGKQVQKICSVSASIATMAFNKYLATLGVDPSACFDSRCFVIPKSEVNNYFIWRQQDATRNSIQGLGQYYFSHTQLHGHSNMQVKTNLKNVYNVDWDTDCATWQKQGWCVVRNVESIGETNGTEVMRTNMDPDWEIPLFVEDRDYVNKYVLLDG